MNFSIGHRFFLTLFLIIFIFNPTLSHAKVREYWIAAQKVQWDYAPSGQNLIDPQGDLGVWGKTLAYTKYRYIGYTDGHWLTPLPQPEWMGILGPQLRAEVGDTIKVHFLNQTDRPLSMHPHGVFYNKDNEGADNEGAGKSVPPNASYTYKWIVDVDDHMMAGMSTRWQVLPRKKTP